MTEKKAKKRFVRLTPIDDERAFGPRLRAMRENAGLSLRDLSFPGCSPSYISRLENGSRLPSLQLVCALASRLEVPPDQLLGRSPSERAEDEQKNATTVLLDEESIYPRDAEHRYRIYARTGKNDLRVLACAGSSAALGVALVQLDEDARESERRLVDEGAIGVLDAVEGRWIVLPWHRPERTLSFGPLPVEVVR